MPHYEAPCERVAIGRLKFLPFGRRGPAPPQPGHFSFKEHAVPVAKHQSRLRQLVDAQAQHRAGCPPRDVRTQCHELAGRGGLRGCTRSRVERALGGQADPLGWLPESASSISPTSSTTRNAAVIARLRVSAPRRDTPPPQPPTHPWRYPQLIGLTRLFRPREGSTPNRDRAAPALWDAPLPPVCPRGLAASAWSCTTEMTIIRPPQRPHFSAFMPRSRVSGEKVALGDELLVDGFAVLSAQVRKG